MPSFGTGSQNKLNTCHKNIIEICNEAIHFVDFSIITGHRTLEEQNALYPKYTKLKWPDGKHNKLPSLAVDVAPYIKPYGVIFGNPTEIVKMMDLTGVSEEEAKTFVQKSYARLIGIIEGIAFQRNIKIRVGIDWDGDFDMLDQTFHDLGHWELIE